MTTLFRLCQQIIQKPSHDLKQQLATYSKRVAGSVTELIQAAEAMKGTVTSLMTEPHSQLVILPASFPIKL